MGETLLLEMVERMSIAATLAFILSQTTIFRRINYRYITLLDKVKLSIIFGCIGIVGTYAGIPVDDALANSRVVGVMAAGLLGGPVMGTAAGLIAGGHRYLLFGGFSAFSCALSNVVEGLFAGWVKQRCPHNPMPWWIALISGVVGEMMQMAIILLTARPFDMAFTLVQHIALPMIVANSIGLTIFMLIIKMTMDVQQQAGAAQSQKALAVAAQTLPYFRKGLDKASAKAAAEIIYANGSYHAIAVTDTEQVLAFIGAEAEHHLSYRHGLTLATNHALQSGDIYIAKSQAEIGCPFPHCRLTSAIVVPLKCGEQVIGTFKLYYTNKNLLNQSDVVFANGLAQLFSIQLELAQIDYQAKLAAHAELKALQAQINPHFLFNTLNTITSLVRTKPDLARNLLLKLSAIFRFTLQKAGRNITIAEELTQVRAYLSIAAARYGNKLHIEEKIDPVTEVYLVPSLTIQPIIENAITHGLKPKVDGGTITIAIQNKINDIIITITDDGVGMDLRKLNPLHHALSTEHIGLMNVHERLHGQYGGSYGLTIDSTVGHGTAITITLPKITANEGDVYAQKLDC
ncbi:two-component system sensor histidine kinase LytS [Sporomusaceae bacterium BoRhaA]|uniref:LytS/YhcK type 5TM receptor domain-containing protein n=1 Tax=Pelorhabdus rhamnosifermentans TaxID=2772457 RepID=UPI001C062C3B|nr:LytS/YhcK type 5TM receptor domain-containing protein [Pelorhabdus rhamnosifermentans]MBU2702550.1 two-component system sensor histidine kinase LytS [Pelorhabdus rhamnosifermentans]